MILELVVTLLAGVAGAGAALALRRVLPAIPRWTVPVAAGAAMLAASVAMEYAWFDRMRAALPEGVEVAVTQENRALWRPWTRLAPYVDGFIAVDRAGLRTNPAAEGQRLAELYVFGRWQPTRRMRAVFDCPGGRRADLAGAADLGVDGAVPEAAWIATGADDAVARLVCEGA